MKSTLLLFSVWTCFTHLSWSAMGQQCGNVTYQACIICSTPYQGTCTSTEKSSIVNFVLPYFRNVYTSRGLTPPRWMGGVGQRRRLTGRSADDADDADDAAASGFSHEEFDNATKAHADPRQLANTIPTCSDLCRVNPGYCMYYSCNSHPRSLLEGVAGPPLTANTLTMEKMMMNPYETVARLPEEESDRRSNLKKAVDPRRRTLMTNSQCWNFLFYLPWLLNNATYDAYRALSSTSLLSTSCKDTTWKSTCSIMVIPIYPPTTGCCSLDFKTCVNYCGMTPDICGGCDVKEQYTWLPSGNLTNSCVARWGGCDASRPCCNGLICKYMQPGWNQCTAPKDV